MNKLYALALTALLFTCTSISAQDALKIGHINSQEMVQLMPETAEAELELQTYQAQLEKQLQDLQVGYQAEVQKFTTLPEGTPESTAEDLRSAIINMEQRIQNFQMKAEQDLMKKQEEILTPILTKLQEAIDAVAAENKFSYIMDTSTGTVIYTGGGEDISALVKTKLGIAG